MSVRGNIFSSVATTSGSYREIQWCKCHVLGSGSARAGESRGAAGPRDAFFFESLPKAEKEGEMFGSEHSKK